MTYYNVMVMQRARGVQETEPLSLRPLIAEYTATFGIGWGPVTRRKHRDDFARCILDPSCQQHEGIH